MTSMLLGQNETWNWLMGDDPGRAGTPQMQWANLPESWGVFLLIAIVGLIAFGVFWLYRRELDICPMPVKLTLAGLRLTVLLLLVAMLLQPSMFYQQVNEIKPNIDLVRDASMSFARGDRYRDESLVAELAKSTGLDSGEIGQGEVPRSTLLNRAIADPKWLRAVREKGTVQVVDFSDGTKSVAVIPAIIESTVKKPQPATRDDSAQLPDDNASESNSSDEEPADRLIRQTVPDLQPDGLGTDIWQALRESLDNASNLSAIVLVSDGQHNGSEDPIEMALRAATLDIPIHVVGIGDPNPPRNIAVTEVFVRDKTYPDEPFEVEALVQASSFGDAGMPDQINLELIQQAINQRTGEAENEQIIDTRKIDLPETGGRIRIDFDHTVSQPGRYIYTVRAETVDNEINTGDNSRQSAEMEVVDEQIKVLLIAGLPSWDYQQVQRLLQRDASISLSCWLQSMDQSRPQEGNEPINRLPRTLEELGQYNVILLIDPNPEEFDAAWMETLQSFCKNKAGGVMFMAGPQFTSEFVTLNRLSGIRDVLPVRLGDAQYIASSDALAFADPNDLASMLPVKHNMDHPVLSFHSEAAENEKRWASLPGIYWSFPALAAKPTARVLMERGEQPGAEGNIPLIVAGRFGAGTVLYLGFPGTWRWRPAGLQAQFFDRFWIQVVRYLVENRSLQGSRRGFIDTDRTEYELGDRITFVGRVLDEQFQPSATPTFMAKITNQNGRIQNVEMQLLPGDSGQYEGNVIASRTGSFQATINLGDDGDSTRLIEPVSWRVVPPKVESNAFWLNEKLLQEIADKSGGKYFRVSEISQLPEILPRRVQRVAFKSPAKPLWDWNRYFRYFAFLLPVILLTAEWGLRKWYKLM